VKFALLKRRHGGNVAIEKEIDITLADTRLKKARIDRLTDRMKKWQSVILAVTLVLATYLFSWLVRVTGKQELSQSAISRAYLYLIGSNMFLPTLVASFRSPRLTSPNASMFLARTKCCDTCGFH
jgi:uncharacterized membrane protein (DUF106 family)